MCTEDRQLDVLQAVIEDPRGSTQEVFEYTETCNYENFGLHPTMTLPVALLIASLLDPSTAEEIRESIGNRIFLMEPLSCGCIDHLSSLCLLPPTLSCSSARSSPTSDLGSEISTSSCSTIKSYSYFSDSTSIEEITTSETAEPKNKAELFKSLSVLVDVLENCEARFKESYIFKGGQQEINLEKMKIHYKGRDILDLGNNIKQSFPLTLSTPDPENANFNKYWPRIGIERRCSEKSCDFKYLHPLA